MDEPGVTNPEMAIRMEPAATNLISLDARKDDKKVERSLWFLSVPEDELPKRDVVPVANDQADTFAMLNAAREHFAKAVRIMPRLDADCGAIRTWVDDEGELKTEAIPSSVFWAAPEGLRDASKTPELPVTPEMVAAGTEAYRDTQAWLSDQFEVGLSRLYRAMAALAPVPLVTDGELAALRERDEALKSRAHWEEWFWDMSDRFDAAIDRWDSEEQTLRAQLAAAQEAVTRAEALARENARLLMTLAARDQAIAGLKSQMTKRPDALPENPKPNPFRASPRDPRRIGP